MDKVVDRTDGVHKTGKHKNNRVAESNSAADFRCRSGLEPFAGLISGKKSRGIRRGKSAAIMIPFFPQMLAGWVPPLPE
jgi:hypothetical protein